MNAYKNIVNYTLVLMLLAGASAVQANNISVSNITLTGRDVSAGTNNSANFSLVQFNISWENSWRRSSVQSNWDAAWVFVKYRRAGGTWQHAWLNNTGHTAPSGSTIDVGLLTPGSAFNASTNPGMGAFIYRSAAGAGNNTFNSVQLRWNYGAQSIPDTAVLELSVFAVEMVYVPQGSFYVGDGLVSRSIVNASASGTTITLSSGSTANLAAGDLIGGSTLQTNTFIASITNSTTFEVNQAPTTNFSNQTLSISLSGHFYDASDATNRPAVQIQNENQLTLGGTTAGSLGSGITSSGTDRAADEFSSSTAQTLPAAFPKGFNAFYCMKYELSQGQYRDFLNTLTRDQQANRVGATITAGTTSVTNVYVMSNTTTVQQRNGIRCDATIPASGPVTFYCDLDGDGVPNESNDGEWIPCARINWPDDAAYSDWAGLRPMTELEYEKACRGTLAPVKGEYAWGSTTGVIQVTGFSNSGNINETATPAGANMMYATGSGDGVTGGPIRSGALASSASSRTQAGSTYYGIMNMSDNLYERIVSVSHAEGRSFTGVHGNGSIHATGFADITTWPGYNGSSTLVDLHKGTGLRGNSFVHQLTNHRVSDRSNANYFPSTRDRHRGYRAVRTAP